MTALDEFLAPIRERLAAAPDKNFIGRAATEMQLLGTDVPRLLAALDGVLALHQPITVYEYDLDKGELNEDKVMAELCRECTGDSVIDAIGDCEYDPTDYHDETPWPCPTVAAINSALEGQG